MSCMFVMHTLLRLNELDVGVQSTRIFFTAAAIDLEILKEEVSPSLSHWVPSLCRLPCRTLTPSVSLERHGDEH